MRFQAEICRLEDFLFFIEEAAIEAFGDGERRTDVLVAAEEAFTNIAMHAYTEDGDVEVKVHALPGQLTLTLVDEGAPFDPTVSPLPDLEAIPEDRPIGRLGVHLILKLADEVRYRRESGRNILTIVARVEGVNRSGIKEEER